MEPVEVFLRWLADIERSPNTVRAYAGDLRQFWEFVELRGCDWAELGLEELGDFAAGCAARRRTWSCCAGGDAARQASTVNRKLAAVAAFYDFHHRQSGVRVAERLHAPSHRSGRGSFKPMLEGFAPQRPRGRPGRLPERRRLPRVLSLSQVEAILRAQRRLRDRFLFALLFQTGMRVGQALGLRHEDVVTWENRIEIVCREDNANGARGKGGEGSVPVAAALMRLYARVHARRVRLARLRLRVRELVGRPGGAAAHLRDGQRHRAGDAPRGRVSLHPALVPAHVRDAHRRAGVPLEVVSQLITHRSVQTTQQIYTHLDVEDLRAQLRGGRRAGDGGGPGVSGTPALAVVGVGAAGRVAGGA